MSGTSAGAGAGPDPPTSNGAISGAPLNQIGKAHIHREGTDLTIVTYAAMVHKSQGAAGQLEKVDRLSVEVIDLRTLLPLEAEAIEWLDAPIPYSPPLEDFFLPQVEDVVKAARFLVT